MDVSQADAYHAARGYADWAAASLATRTAALVRAQDYIGATYTLRSTLTAPEQNKLDSATSLLARALLTDTTPLRAAPAVTKESKEGAGFKKSTEYADAPTDAYPFISVLLAPLLVDTGVACFALGKLVR